MWAEILAFLKQMSLTISHQITRLATLEIHWEKSCTWWWPDDDHMWFQMRVQAPDSQTQSQSLNLHITKMVKGNIMGSNRVLKGKSAPILLQHKQVCLKLSVGTSHGQFQNWHGAGRAPVIINGGNDCYMEDAVILISTKNLVSGFLKSYYSVEIFCFKLL